MSRRIPLLVPDLPPLDAMMSRLMHINTTRRASNFGGLVIELERRLGAELGCHVITTANATLALELALTSLNLPAGSTVACPALTFPASATAILRAGHTPYFIDVGAETWCGATNEISFGGGKRFSHEQDPPSAILNVSAFGAGLGEAQAGADGLSVVLDSAPAWGNQRAFAGVLTCYSLHATKGLVAGEGGAIATHDPAVAKHLRALTNFGIGTGNVGTNAKMSEYHAAVALASLDSWPERSASRRRAAKDYRELLTVEIPTLGWQKWDEGWTRTIFPVLLPEGSNVPKVMKMMDAEGVETRRWYYPLVCDSYRFSESRRWALPVSRSISERLLGLPFFTGISHEQMERVAKCLKAALSPAR